VNVTELMEKIITIRKSDLLVVLDRKFKLLIDLIFESVHSERRWSIPLGLREASRLNYLRDQTAYAISTVSTETQQSFFVTIQPFSVCKVFISSQSSTVRCVMFTCTVTSLTTWNQFRLFIKEI